MQDKYRSIGVPQDEVNVQILIAEKCKHGIVELGVLFGETSEKFCEANPDVDIWGIDPLIPDSMNPALIGDMNKILALVDKYDNFIWIPDYSYNMVEVFKLNENKFDYLFIDASHIYEDVKRDFEDWFPLLEKGGVVSLHDSAMGRGGPDYWPGPTKLAEELFNDKRVEYVKTVYCLTIFKKL